MRSCENTPENWKGTFHVRTDLVGEVACGTHQVRLVCVDLLAYSLASHASHHFRSHYLDGRTDRGSPRRGRSGKDDGGVSLIAVAAVHNRGVGKQKQRRGEAAWEEATKPRKKRNNPRTMRLCARAFGRSRSVGLAARRRREVDYVRAGERRGWRRRRRQSSIA